jgi:hypothetical protein
MVQWYNMYIFDGTGQKTKTFCLSIGFYRFFDDFFIFYVLHKNNK